MRKWILAALVALAGVAAVVAVPTAGAKSRGVIKTGKCTGSSTWKLKAKLDDGRIETEFEVDQNVVGRRWRVVLRQNGVVAFRAVRTTQAPSGSFEVRRFLPNGAGADRVTARARALTTGEICRGSVTL